MNYIKEYNKFGYYERISEDYLWMIDDDGNMVAKTLDIKEITKSDIQSLKNILHNDNFPNQWIRYQKIFIENLEKWRLIASPKDGNRENKALGIIIIPEFDLSSKEWYSYNKIEFYIESFLMDDDYFIVKITSVYQPNHLQGMDQVKWFKCDQMDGLFLCIKEEVTNWYPGLKKVEKAPLIPPNIFGNTRSSFSR